MTNTGDKVLITLQSLGYVLLSIFLFIMLFFGWPVSMGQFENLLADWNLKWSISIVLAAVFLLNFLLFLKSIGKDTVKFSVLHETELGQVNITLSALEQLVLKGSSNVSGIRDVKPNLRLTSAGIVLNLRVQVIPDIHIPQVTGELQQTVRDYLLKTTGTSLQAIKVQVTKISTDEKFPKISRVG